MNETRDPNEAAAAGDEGEFDPREAAVLLQQTKRRARTRFNPNPPLMSLLRAIVAFCAYGAVWLSVRGQRRQGGDDPQPGGDVDQRVQSVGCVGGHRAHLQARCRQAVAPA